MAGQELVLDPGVLLSSRCCELQGFSAVVRAGGRAVLPWRREWQRARNAGVDAVPLPADLGQEFFGQCVVHLQKSRPGTWADLVAAWQHLEPGGALLLCGHNTLGVRSAIKRLGQELRQEPEVLSNRAHGRVVRFHRDDGPGPTPPAVERVEIPTELAGGRDDDNLRLESAPGLFSAGRLDPGTRLLLECMVTEGAGPLAPRLLFDPGCGIGPLGLAALRHWPGCRAVLADGDARAIACARMNAVRLGLDGRCELHWWDAGEPPPVTGCDRTVLNPPFHAGKGVDLALARAMLKAAIAALAPGGLALVVANRSLPYEAELRAGGVTRELARAHGYKVLAMTKTRGPGSGRS